MSFDMNSTNIPIVKAVYFALHRRSPKTIITCFMLLDQIRPVDAAAVHYCKMFGHLECAATGNAHLSRPWFVFREFHWSDEGCRITASDGTGENEETLAWRTEVNIDISSVWDIVGTKCRHERLMSLPMLTHFSLPPNKILHLLKCRKTTQKQQSVLSTWMSLVHRWH